MSFINRICVIILCAILLISIMPVSAFAAGASNINDSLYISTEDELISPISYNNYLEIMSSVTSFTTTTGGTLVLDYTGSLSPLSNVIYTKVIYFTAEQLVFYQNALYSEGLRDYIIAEFISEGIEIITPAIALSIALYLGIGAGTVTFLVGESLNLFVWILNNLDKWDLSDAVNRSTTGKVKLECYYLQSVSAPYYQEIENFEPWNSNTVEVPDYYDHMWFENVYDYESNVCEHEFDQYTSNLNGTHGKYCDLCNCTIFVTCRYRCTRYSTTRHKATCIDCGYSYYEAHNWNIGGNLCLSCGFNTEGSLIEKIDGDNLNCLLTME